ncbi:MAG: hypothetical protein R3E39_10075 [Anaerolineae bacterium]
MTITTRTQRLDHIERGIRRTQTVQTRAQTASNRLGWWRLWAFLAAGGLALILLQMQVHPIVILLEVVIGVMIFTVLVGRHRRVNTLLKRCALWLEIQRTHAARGRLDWAHIPAPPEFKQHPEHPFENDLDLTGSRSLLHLLDTTSSLQSSKRLRDWLLATEPDAAVINERHTLLDEMSAAYADRMSLTARLAADTRQMDTRRLLAWLTDVPESSLSGRYVLLLAGLCGVSAVLYVLFRTVNLPPIFVVSFLAYFVLSLRYGRESLTLLNQAFDVQYALSGVQHVFRFIESQHYDDKPALKALCQPFLSANRPSAELRELGLIIGAAALRNNGPLWLLLNALVPWDLYLAYRLNRLRHKLAVLMPDWLTVWHTLDALAALRLFAHMNPEYTRPEWVEGMVFEARVLGHPLIAHEQRVCNDFTMDTGQVTMLTGSNMSGKSSFLRTLGINMVLANTGAVVSAGHLRLSHYRLYACIKVNDSLADGYSYFYAEVRRLKGLLDALENHDPYPLFYLIDEIFKGTNNRERLLGSESFIRALAGKRGTGAISTHDLELATMPDLNNFHFADDVRDGQLSFDYHLRAGVSPTTNALRIMRLAGLPTPEA